MFRDKARRHSLARDAVLHIVGRTYTFSPKAADNKHKSTVALLLSPRRLNFYTYKVCPRGYIYPILTSLHNLATINHMRAHLSYHGLGRTVESETAGCHTGGSDIPLRHQQHETSLYN